MPGDDVAFDRPTALDWTAAEPNAGAHDAGFSYIGGRLLTRKTFGFTTREVRDINDPMRSGYDGLGRPVYLNYGAGTLTFGYDAVSNRTFQFDSNRVGTDPAAGGNGVRDLEAYGYDNVYRLIQHTTGVAVSPPTVASSVTQTGDTRLNGQLTVAPAVSGSPAREQEWSLDGVGSWAQFTIDGVTQTNQTGDINQYTEFAGNQLDHAPNGNTVRDAPTVAANGFAYEFDAFNRLRRVFDPATNATVGLYSYDAAGRRVTRQADINHDGVMETGMRYIFDGARVIEERLLADRPGIGLRGDLLRQYVYGLYIDEPLWTELTATGADLANLPFAGAPPPVLNAANQALAAAPPLALAGQYLFAQDANYNVYALFDTTGAIVEQYRYDAYGTFQLYDGFGTELAAKNAPSLLNPYLFQGRRYDPESGLFYFRARFYNPFTGRFLSFDPLGFIDGMGLFAFGMSTPHLLTDPFGASTWLADFDAAIGSPSQWKVLQWGSQGLGGFFDGAINTVTFGYWNPEPFKGLWGNRLDESKYNTGRDIGEITTVTVLALSAYGLAARLAMVQEILVFGGFYGQWGLGVFAGTVGGAAHGGAQASRHGGDFYDVFIGNALGAALGMTAAYVFEPIGIALGAAWRGARNWWSGTKPPCSPPATSKAAPPQNCFVAGTPVWVLKDDVDPETATVAIANGEPIEAFAETKPIEDVTSADYVLSRQDDDPDAPLVFQRVLELIVGYYDEVHWLTITDPETGESETIGTARHPFWVTDLGNNPLAPIADVEQPHNGAAGATYAHSLSDITDRHIASRDVKQGWVLTLADGRRVVVESARLTAEALRQASDDAPISRIEPVILGSAGWMASSHIQPGACVAGARPLGLRVDAVRVESGRVATYNLMVEGSHTYFIGRLASWVHNQTYTLQTGGNKITDNTAKKLNEYFDTNLHKRDWGRALDGNNGLKKSLGLPNNHHGKIKSNGDYTDMDDNVLGNLSEYIP